MTQQNEFDKLKYGIPFEYCEFVADIPPQNYALGVSYKKNENKFIFEVSGKLFAAQTDLGSITSDNFSQIPNRIQDLFGITTDKEYFYEGAEVYRVDIKKDLLMDEPVYRYINDIRKQLLKKSDDYNTNFYRKLKYEHGLVIIPNTVSSKYRFSIYNKGIEIKRHKYGSDFHKQYYDLFDFQFLEQTQKILRIELQLNNYKQIRRMFNLEKRGVPSVSSIFNCQNDVLRYEFTKLVA